MRSLLGASAAQAGAAPSEATTASTATKVVNRRFMVPPSGRRTRPYGERVDEGPVKPPEIGRSGGIGEDGGRGIHLQVHAEQPARQPVASQALDNPTEKD